MAFLSESDRTDQEDEITALRSILNEEDDEREEETENEPDDDSSSKAFQFRRNPAQDSQPTGDKRYS